MLNETVKKARMYSCLTQEEMADLLNMSKTKYLRKENGLAKFERNEVKIIAKILKLDENQLLTYWISDSIYEIMKNDKVLVNDALQVLQEHLDDYEKCVIMPNKSDSYSSNNDRMMHRYYK